LWFYCNYLKIVMSLKYPLLLNFSAPFRIHRFVTEKERKINCHYHTYHYSYPEQVGHKWVNKGIEILISWFLKFVHRLAFKKEQKLSEYGPLPVFWWKGCRAATTSPPPQKFWEKLNIWITDFVSRNAHSLKEYKLNYFKF
jgi:hypothetical protein